MIGLAKAEWYRLVHTGILKYFVAICLIFPILIMITDINWYKMTASGNMLLFAQNAAMMLPLFLAVAISIPICQEYQNRIAYYEIMSGIKTCKIILSKVIVYTAIFVLGTAFTLGTFFTVIGMINGFGDMSNLPLSFVLFLVVIIRICAVAVLICTLVKHIIAFAVSILRFMIFDNLLLMLLTPIDAYLDSAMDIAEISSRSVSDWFISGQMSKIFCANIDANLILMIIITAIFEIALWYLFAYISYKRKMFK